MSISQLDRSKNATFRIAAAGCLFFVVVGVCLADEIELVGGDVIEGDVVLQDESTIVLDHNDLGRLEIPREKIKSVTFISPVLVRPGQGVKKVEITAEEEAPEEEEEAVMFEPEFTGLSEWAVEQKKKGWSASADVSFNSSSGNTDERSLRIGADAKRERPDTRLAIDLAYYNKTSEGDTTDNKFTGGMLHDWLFPESRWFWFGSGRYDFDEFESWEQRLAAHTGPGYHLIEDEKTKLDLRVGAGARKEFGSENNNVRFEGAGGLFWEWIITKRQKLSATSAIYPVLTDVEDYRTRTTANWRFRLKEEMNLSLLIGIEHEYQSIVDPGSDKNDTRTYIGIQFGF